jgi:hypothetical protein
MRPRVLVGVRTVCIATLIALIAVGCSGASDSTSSVSGRTSEPGSTRSATTPASSASPTLSTPACPNPEGQACLGALAAGTYTTRLFQPAITYTVAAGWKNFEDTPGNFLLVPPSGNLPGVNAATSDFIGIYTSVGAPNGCQEGAAPGFLATPADIARWISRQRSFAPPHFRPVTVGGLSGQVADLRMAPGWRKTCSYSNGLPVAPLMTGLGITGLDHNLVPGQATRLYLLAYQQGALAIEVVDIKDAAHLRSYSRLVQKLRFGT